MHRYRRHAAEVSVPWTHEDESYTVTVSIGPDQQEVRYGDNACPFVAGDVEILAVEEEGTGRSRPDLIDAADDDKDAIEEAAREYMQADLDAGEEDEADRRRELAREDALDRKHGREW